MGGDEEPGDHEEDVHAHVPAGEGLDPGVEQHHEHHRDRPQPLDVGAEAGFAGARWGASRSLRVGTSSHSHDNETVTGLWNLRGSARQIMPIGVWRGRFGSSV